MLSSSTADIEIKAKLNSALKIFTTPWLYAFIIVLALCGAMKSAVYSSSVPSDTKIHLWLPAHYTMMNKSGSTYVPILDITQASATAYLSGNDFMQMVKDENLEVQVMITSNGTVEYQAMRNNVYYRTVSYYTSQYLDMCWLNPQRIGMVSDDTMEVVMVRNYENVWIFLGLMSLIITVIAFVIAAFINDKIDSRRWKIKWQE